MHYVEYKPCWMYAVYCIWKINQAARETAWYFLDRSVLLDAKHGYSNLILKEYKLKPDLSAAWQWKYFNWHRYSLLHKFCSLLCVDVHQFSLFLLNVFKHKRKGNSLVCFVWSLMLNFRLIHVQWVWKMPSYMPFMCLSYWMVLYCLVLLGQLYWGIWMFYSITTVTSSASK